MAVTIEDKEQKIDYLSDENGKLNSELDNVTNLLDGNYLG